MDCCCSRAAARESNCARPHCTPRTPQAAVSPAAVRAGSASWVAAADSHEHTVSPSRAAAMCSVIGYAGRQDLCNFMADHCDIDSPNMAAADGSASISPDELNCPCAPGLGARAALPAARAAVSRSPQAGAVHPRASRPPYHSPRAALTSLRRPVRRERP